MRLLGFAQALYRACFAHALGAAVVVPLLPWTTVRRAARQASTHPASHAQVLLHHEQFKIPENLARFAVKAGMGGFVKKMGPAVVNFVANRRQRVDPVRCACHLACVHVGSLVSHAGWALLPACPVVRVSMHAVCSLADFHPAALALHRAITFGLAAQMARPVNCTMEILGRLTPAVACLQFEADPDAYGVRRMTRSVSAVSAVASCDGSEATDGTFTTASTEDGDDRFPEVRAHLQDVSVAHRSMLSLTTTAGFVRAGKCGGCTSMSVLPQTASHVTSGTEHVALVPCMVCSSDSICYGLTRTRVDRLACPAAAPAATTAAAEEAGAEAGGELGAGGRRRHRRGPHRQQSQSQPAGDVRQRARAGGDRSG